MEKISRISLSEAIDGAHALQAYMELIANQVGEGHPLYSTYKQVARDINGALKTINDELSE
jgi:hypothetical protein